MTEGALRKQKDRDKVKNDYHSRLERLCEVAKDGPKMVSSRGFRIYRLSRNTF